MSRAAFDGQHVLRPLPSTGDPRLRFYRLLATMKPLAFTEEESVSQSQIEVLVVGSGFGGSVAAARIAEAGARVVLLERGPW